MEHGRKLNGVIIGTNMETDHVIEQDIFSKHYMCPRKNEKRNETFCQANYTVEPVVVCS